MPTLRITGEVRTPLELTAESLAAFRAEERVDDVSKLGSSRSGAGVYLQALLSRARPKPGVRYITFCSPRDDFAASIPLDRVAETGVVIYARNGKPMTASDGGPFRFIIPDPAACRTDEVDDCANVKFIEEIILSSEKGRDTRPDTPEKHKMLHDHEG